MKHADLIDDGGPSLHSLPKEMQQTLGCRQQWRTKAAKDY